MLQTSVHGAIGLRIENDPAIFPMSYLLCRGRIATPCVLQLFFMSYSRLRACQYFVQSYSNETYTKTLKPFVVISLTALRPTQDLLNAYASNLLLGEYVDGLENVSCYLSGDFPC